MTKQNRIISNYDVTLLLVYRKKAQTEKKNRSMTSQTISGQFSLFSVSCQNVGRSEKTLKAIRKEKGVNKK